MNIIIVNHADETMSDFLQELNPSQLKAVRHTEGPLLIIAGAGSGKTRVLTYRIAYLLREGVAPHQILALTFTNKAAGEMKERIAHVTGERAASQVWAGTFHSIFARLLRYEAEHLDYTSSYSIYDAEDSLSVVKNIMNSMGYSQQQFPPQAVRGRISSAKNQMIGPREYAAQASNLAERQTAEIYIRYEERLRANNAMDFDDILLNMIRLLQRYPEILQKYRERFRYIMVDEYQDTNRAQYTAIRMLAGGHNNIAVVGDDAQSIYKWRGADIRNILDFQKDYPNAETVKLERNYRSTKAILAAADSVIKRNKRQLDKTLWTENSDGEPVRVIQAWDDRQEAAQIAEIIRCEISENFRNMRDFAVLYRTNAQSQALEDALRRASLRYTIVGGMSFYKRKEIKDVLSYLRLLVNQSDSESLLRIINEPSRGLGSVSLGYLQDFATRENIPLFEAFMRVADVPALMPRARKSAADFAAFIRRFAERVQRGESIVEIAVEYIEATGMPNVLREERTDEAEDRLRNIERVLSNIGEYAAHEDNPTLEGFLQQISLAADIDDTDASANAVTLMTLHSAKGLEFPTVFVAGLEQGLFPLARTENDPDEKEEERRLFYVGITRACKQLFLSYAERRFRFGELAFNEPSCFLDEIPSDTLEWKRGDSLRRTPKSADASRPAPFITRHNSQFTKPARTEKPFYDDIPRNESYSQLPPPANSRPNIRAGQRVRHAQFGIGTVNSVVERTSGEWQAVVQFQNVGRKQLLLRYAKLEIIG
ncbi:UvrD-helicase domain-containing protein [Ignavibacteria bacterium]|nr:UvrD-helicase domain-containing protein [Bacteroidota bacterium]MCZ2132298.1 UvrD-helicase domain-containing protein [Bacteroidota bacterium]